MVSIHCAQLSYGRDSVQMKSDQHKERGQVDRQAWRVRRRGSTISFTFYFTETEISLHPSLSFWNPATPLKKLVDWSQLIGQPVPKLRF